MLIDKKWLACCNDILHFDIGSAFFSFKILFIIPFMIHIHRNNCKRTTRMKERQEKKIEMRPINFNVCMFVSMSKRHK